MWSEKMNCPRKIIDWEQADTLLTSGCTGSEVAGYFGMHPDTFYRRCEEEKSIGFSAYLQEKRSNGKALLRAKQYAKAMGKTDSGDTTLLIWLGKVSLDQIESKKIEDQEKEKKFDEKMDQVLKLLSPSVDLKIDDSSINNDTKS